MAAKSLTDLVAPLVAVPDQEFILSQVEVSATWIPIGHTVQQSLNANEFRPFAVRGAN